MKHFASSRFWQCLSALPVEVQALARANFRLLKENLVHLHGKGFTVTDLEPTNYGATTAHMDGPDGCQIWFQQWNGRAAAV